MDYTYETPEFLQGQSADEIHGRMLNLLPSDIDKSENSIPWDFTRPSALEKANFVEFQLNETIKLIFPQWAYGEWLDYHGEIRNVYRKRANPATGILKVTGLSGTVIPKGFCFATVAQLSSSILFQTVEEFVLSGEVNPQNLVENLLEVEAVLGGVSGNVVADSVKLMSKPLSGISYVCNPDVFSGGTDEESDESFKERILDAILLGSSFTGCNSDYIRWAKEVSGVGFVVVEPEWDDPSLPEEFHYTDTSGVKKCAGAVRLIIADENGYPANEQILEDVKLHILGVDDSDIARLAPIGAHVSVIAPEGLEISVSAQLYLDEGEELSTVISRISTNLATYWSVVAGETQESELGISYLRWVQVGAIVAKTLGVVDYQDLLVNGGTENILVTQAQYPVTGEVDFYV